ncbi:phenoloxidase 1-like [Lasioglossum baleicum]|uniref:phenoloxidase 1-like n=1 Tax=Lasioglossum baleicum TaxID=434251 RepID=UPI003FCE9080
MAIDKSGILYLFYRPFEPVYMPKGQKKVAFDIPVNYLPEKSRSTATEIFSRFADKIEHKIDVKPIHPPDLAHLVQLGRHEPFSLFISAHHKLAGKLIDIFMGTKTYDDFLSTAVYCRDRLNVELFMYALSVAILHHPETKHLPIPQLYKIFPDKFVDDLVLTEIKENVNLIPAESGAQAATAVEIIRDFTASDLNIEHRLAYWREDLGFNMHHWHWHLVYPFAAEMEIVNKDRRGELFYYMHEQVIARYNCERLCNHLIRVKHFTNWREPITEAYFPKMLHGPTGRTWPARPSESVLHDLERPEDGAEFTIHDLERWRERILNAIHTGSVMNTNGEQVPLTEQNGIDILGNIVESSILSPNRDFYGELHNNGHLAIAYCHDPDNRNKEILGVMGDNSTSPRDPIFYRWHGFINDVFFEFKNTLPPYEISQLNYLGIEVEDVKLTTNNEDNVLHTFWNQSEVDLTSGLDWLPPEPVRVKFTHLNHANFTYTITVNNTTTRSKKGTVRIFIAPMEDERRQPFSFAKQKGLMIEMDKFSVTLQPGRNVIQQKSTDSSVTIPFEQTFPPRDTDSTECPKPDNFCGCGWPQHLLVPKGVKGGFPMVLFAMVSDYTRDIVEQVESSCCKDGVSYCGLRDKKYPDARAMGYPFDRLPRENVQQLSDFLTKNMNTKPVVIKFEDEIKPNA